MSTADEIVAKIEAAWTKLARFGRPNTVYLPITPLIRKYLRHVHLWRGKRITCHGLCKLRGRA